MPALTELLDKPIRDPNGEEFGRVHDLVVRLGGQQGKTRTAAETYPPVTGIVARLKGPSGGRDVYIPWDQVRSLGSEGAELATPGVNLRRFARRTGEIVLRDALFDKQVVDIEGRRVVRVNDLDLAKRDDTYRLIAVDISPAGLLRRLPIVHLLDKHVARGPLIDWAQVMPVAYGAEGTGALRLRVPRDRLYLLKPADLARIIEQLTPQQGADLLEGMDEARAADALEELEDEQQGQILRAMDPERAADVLQEMEPDEAADALQSVTEEEAADLLQRMDREEAVEVEELLGYPEDSAGGLMTTEYVSVPDYVTVEQVILAMRRRAKEAEADQDDPLPETMQEVYVVAGGGPENCAPPPKRPSPLRRNSRPRPSSPLTPQEVSLCAEGQLMGRVTLRDLLLADPEARMSQVARPVPHPARPLDDEREVARIIAEEDLVALPVIDEHDQLLGIVTVDDAIDVILPTAWKKRMPRLFH